VEFDPETDMWWGEKIKPPPALCLWVTRRNERWRKLVGMQPVETAIKEGDEITFTDSGETRIVASVKPRRGGVSVELKPIP
jgi:hypothetical protein